MGDKTAVIAEICAQAVKQGKRTVIASPSDAVVDEVLARFIDSENVRLVRLGDARAVSEDVLPFHTQHIVGNWLKAVQQRCREQWQGYRQAAAAFGELKSILQQGEDYLNAQNGAAAAAVKLEVVKVKLEQNTKSMQDVIARISELDAHMARLADMRSSLRTGHLDRLVRQLQEWPLPSAAAGQYEDITAPLKQWVATLDEKAEQAAIGPAAREEYVLIKAVRYLQWQQKNSAPYQALLPRLREFSRKFGELIDIQKRLTEHYGKLEEVRGTRKAKAEAASALRDAAGLLQTRIQQLQSFALVPADLEAVMDQAAARDSADWRPVLQEFDPGLQDRLRTLLSAEVAPQWAELWEGARRAADAQAAVVTADEVLVHLRDVERELRDRLGKDSPRSSGTRKPDPDAFLRELGYFPGTLRRDFPAPEAAKDLARRVRALTDRMLGNTFSALIGDLGRSLMDRVQSLFGGRPAEERWIERTLNNLWLVSSGAALLTDLTRVWKARHRELRQGELERRQQFAAAALAAVPRVKSSLSHALATELQTNQHKLSQVEQELGELEEEDTRLSGAAAQIRELLMETKEQIGKELQGEEALKEWEAFGQLAKEFVELPPDADFSQRVGQWQRQFGLTAELLAAVENADLQGEMAKAFAEITRLMEDERAALRGREQELAERAGELAAQYEAVHAELRARQDRCETLGTAWQAVHSRLQELVSLETAEGDIHSYEYLTGLQKRCAPTVRELQKARWVVELVSALYDRLRESALVTKGPLSRVQTTAVGTQRFGG